MIGKLTGKVDALGSGELILDVNGVGYLVSCGSRALNQLSPGQTVELHVETWVRQDHFKLFGFLSEAERAWFVRLQEVQGVGAKSALAVLDALPPAELMQAALLEDKAAVSQAQGVGPRIAARIVGELKGKPAPMGRGGELAMSNVSAPDQQPAAGPLASDAVSALINLGFGGSDAARAVREAMQNLGDEAKLQAIIRTALKELNR